MSDSGWNTIDSDAGVFTELVEKLGVTNVEINDLYSIDSETLRVLQPIYGVIFLFKYGKKDREHASLNKPITGEYDANYQDMGLFFANQMIQNACATQAVLNVLFNVDDVNLGEELNNFKSFVTGFDSEMIGETLSNSELIRSIHNSFSTPSLVAQEDKPPPQDYDDKTDGLFHFVGYVMKNSQIYELDGLKQYPIKHGECQSQDEFIEKLPGVLQDRISAYDASELRFSLLAITNNKLEQARATGDEVEIASQLDKRELWQRENELRKHDYTGLIVQLLKNISKEKSDQEWEALLQKGRNKTQQTIAQSIKKS
ncbi:Yuh2 ubiquitin C-terminal hydrolase [Candida orthopsilosis Co 90-125]|uniref:Ubiquitin carboxyl-terminal hydrolase n=1 Tax=Candida orthopsilosis (strain 90-125) TaxID=1136231 RepID=H8X927_CANO9|nr:Yuh2 ubiquitin C-terminal hydrolase [Candida orthopsilosis Co 90-125]CCG24325.1 Yuh2 ubiquitin C-terminal hydrolase [Candida orthopsilosis Co 90-125]